MSGNKCSYIGCTNSSRNTPGLRKCFFPVHDEEVCKKWILLCGNAALASLDDKQLKQKYLCGNHFPAAVLTSGKLPKGALPVDYRVETAPSAPTVEVAKSYLRAGTSTSSQELLEVQPHLEEKAQGTKRTLPDGFETPERETEEIIFVTPEKASEQSSSSTPPTKKMKTEEFLARLPELPTPTKEKEIIRPARKNVRKIDDLQFLPKLVVEMQLQHIPRTCWTLEQKNASLHMFYKSPSMYAFLRKQGFILPSTSTLKNYINNYRTIPGYNKSLFQRLKVKVSTMESNEKKCALLFDEMDIKQNLELCKSSGAVLGFENMGEFGFKEVPANKVLVLMVRGIYCNWKLPIAYYFTHNGVRAEVLAQIIKKNFIYLADCGLTPLAVVCDQSSVNQKLYKSLKVTPENPYFYLGDVKYYAIYDAPHLLKSVRNNLLAGDFILNDEIISWRYIKQLYAIDKHSETARAMTKITDLHINPNNFQKMSVRLAVQIFSHTVAAAMATAVGTNQLPNEALATARFIKIMDSTFDALNSRFPFSPKPANCPLSDSNPQVLESLDTAINTMYHLKKIQIKDSEICLSVPPSFLGLIQTINAIKMLYDENKTEDFPYLLTGRLNQDPLENIFSRYRQRGGYNQNPTARTFSALFKSNSVNGLLKPPDDTNCEPDEDRELFVDSAPTMPVPEGSDVESLSASSSTSEETLLEDCSVSYFAGYLAKKLLEKYDCQFCRKNFIGEKRLNDQQQLLILNKNYDINEKFHLNVPTKKLIKITRYAMAAISKYWMKYSNKNLVLIFQKHLLKYIDRNFPGLATEQCCKEHVKFILKLLITSTLHKKCKWYSSDVKSKQQKNKPSHKLRIMKHY